MEETPLIVNKRELARLLKISPPTLDARLDAEPEFPISQKGGPGVPWEFNTADVLEYERAKIEAERAETRRRAEALAKIQPGMFTPGEEGPENPDYTPQQRLQAARAATAERKLARDARLLVHTGEVKQALEDLFASLGRKMDQLPQDLTRKFNLPSEVARHIKSDLDDWRRKAVAEIDKSLDTDPGPDQKRMFG